MKTGPGNIMTLPKGSSGNGHVDSPKNTMSSISPQSLKCWYTLELQMLISAARLVLKEAEEGWRCGSVVGGGQHGDLLLEGPGYLPLAPKLKLQATYKAPK